MNRARLQLRPGRGPPRSIRPTGKAVARLRSRFGMWQSEFARLLGVSTPTIGNWEKKTRQHYDKGIDPQKFPQQTIDEAIRRAKQRDNPRCSDWPRTIGSTTVYRLVENILHT